MIEKRGPSKLFITCENNGLCIDGEFEQCALNVFVKVPLCLFKCIFSSSKFVRSELWPNSIELWNVCQLRIFIVEAFTHVVCKEMEFDLNVVY